MDDIINCSSIAETIIRFQQLAKKRGKSSECTRLREHLVHEILIISYFYPQTDLGLKEEDASDFILYLRPYLEGILLDYQGGEFIFYIRKILQNRLASFYRARNRQTEPMEVAEMDSGINMLFEAENKYGGDVEEQALSCCESQPVSILRSVFAENHLARKRFFIFLSSLCPFISEPDLAIICKDMSINFRETKKIRTYLIKKTEADKIIADMKKTEERRNCNYAMALINEIRASSKREEGLTDEALKYQAKAEHRKDLIKKSLVENRKLSFGIGPSVLAPLFNMSKGTIANDMCLTKRLLAWSLSPESYSDSMMLEMRISRKFASIASKPQKNVRLATFFPHKEFDLCLDYRQAR
ncbi:MAG: hypothetical protein K6F82_06730 [Sphaerochaetaceae bacterium]|nr:hypothetical protein [Sphaerochaetaceae bacterium]